MEKKLAPQLDNFYQSCSRYFQKLSRNQNFRGLKIYLLILTIAMVVIINPIGNYMPWIVNILPTTTEKITHKSSVQQTDKQSHKTSNKAAYKTSWIGNTFGGKKWVQIQMEGIYVTPNGTVYVNSHWDEAGREVGIYKDGDVIGKADDLHGWGRLGGKAITANQKYLYVAMQQSHEGKPEDDYPPKGTTWYNVRRYDLSGKPAPFAGGRGWDKSMVIVNSKSEVTGLATKDKELYVSDTASDRLRVYNTDTMQELRSFSVPDPGAIAIDQQNNLWVVQKKKIVRYSPQGKQLAQQITDVANPSAIAFDPQGRLLVADNGKRQQVLIYNIANKPKQVGTLGDKGGIYGGTSGEVKDSKLYGITGIGTDKSGNIYVSNHGFNSTGADLRKFSSSGKLQWRLLGLQFIDNADADPDSDGRDVFTKNEHFVMDYSKNNGKEWTYKAYTLDKFRYPDDGRLHTTPTSAFVRRLGGKRLLYLSSEMMAERLLIYRFDGEIAVPCGIFGKNHLSWPPNQPKDGSWLWRDINGDGSIQNNEYKTLGEEDGSVWGWEIDSKGDIWQAAEAGYIKHYPYQKLDNHGCPIYGQAIGGRIPMPAPFKTLTRIKYFPKQDVMYLGGYTNEHPNLDGDWGLVGTEIVRFDNWSKKRNLRWRIVLPYNHQTDPKLHIKSIDVAGDRVFAVASKKAEVYVYKATTGEALPMLTPGAEVGGESGWIDIPYGIRAFRRANGEYLVFVEENAKGKVMMYRLPG
ncbi:SMP-30/gluconolactonase/LRE family protein [Nostoc parmelioides]|uniref:SMP-30/gluconolactonase/LRE family protein n=1 Tax=Nostoc parmelioides FACHB-3921 TaxID=2692909 RepID=A0ABR8BC03_9NOSO|nr:SMP-30/gluconolactonase/LRE family protein [Nostoc parmelioides]MBD2250492.1 SMP-30/gluconolactonase/LRE family protein [Nostoc parmelioides FACHB-3921]